jgi:hypothetical protein
MADAENNETQLRDILWQFNGQSPRASREENWPAPPSINQRLGAITSARWSSTSPITQTEKEQFAIIEGEMPGIIDALRTLGEQDIKKLQEQLDEIGAPWTPGRVPVWKD